MSWTDHCHNYEPPIYGNIRGSNFNISRWPRSWFLSPWTQSGWHWHLHKETWKESFAIAESWRVVKDYEELLLLMTSNSSQTILRACKRREIKSNFLIIQKLPFVGFQNGLKCDSHYGVVDESPVRPRTGGGTIIAQRGFWTLHNSPFFLLSLQEWNITVRQWGYCFLNLFSDFLSAATSAHF